MRNTTTLNRVKEQVETLDLVCARLSGGFYESISNREQDWSPLLSLHGLAWSVSQGLANAERGNGVLNRIRNIVPWSRNGSSINSNPGGVHKPFRVKQNEGIIPFSSEHMGYASSDFGRATEFDPITVYSSFLADAAKFIGREPIISIEEHNPLKATAQYILLSRVLPYLDKTNFRREATENKWPLSDSTLVRAREFMADLEKLLHFPIEQFVRDYAEIVGNGALTRQIPPATINLITEPGEWNDGEFTVDEAQYEKVTSLRDKLLQHMSDSEDLGSDGFLETLAGYYFESNHWNYMTYFEAAIEFNSVVKITPSKRREVDIYIDHTGHLDTVRSWMKQIMEGKAAPNLALDGPPGTGKTSALIKAAEDYNVKVISIDLQTAARGLPSLIRQIRPMQKHAFVVYIDNIDTSKFDSEDAGYREYYFEIVNGLERNVEGASSIGNKIRFAMSTSTYDSLPLPLRQRFSHRLTFSLPSVEVATDMASEYMAKYGIEDDVEKVLLTLYQVDDLSAVQDDKLLTPREIRDGVQSFAFIHT